MCSSDLPKTPKPLEMVIKLIEKVDITILNTKMKLDIKKKLSNRSDRVKCVDLHPTLPWVLIALYAGSVTIYDWNTQT